MPIRRTLLALGAVIVLAWSSGGRATGAAAPPTLAYDHVHLIVPDPVAAADWYVTHLGGTRSGAEVHFGATRLMFRQGAAQPSAGSVIDHIGFSFADLDAKMAAWQTAGVKVVNPVRDVPGLFKLAFIEDPWGVKIEAVQDADTPGFHHIHLRSMDPDAMLAWLAASFGGEHAKLKDRIDAVKYGPVWVLVQKSPDAPPPSAGHAIDHLGWRTEQVAATTAQLKQAGVTVTVEPRDAGPLKISFVDGPGGVRVELVQRP